MPTYTYRCQACDHSFDVFQRISAAAEATCPACGGAQTRRQISGGTFHLKGSGWHAADYGAGGRSGAHAAKETPPAAAETKPPCGQEGCGGGMCAASAEA